MVVDSLTHQRFGILAAPAHSQTASLLARLIQHKHCLSQSATGKKATGTQSGQVRAGLPKICSRVHSKTALASEALVGSLGFVAHLPCNRRRLPKACEPNAARGTKPFQRILFHESVPSISSTRGEATVAPLSKLRSKGSCRQRLLGTTERKVRIVCGRKQHAKPMFASSIDYSTG